MEHETAQDSSYPNPLPAYSSSLHEDGVCRRVLKTALHLYYRSRMRFAARVDKKSVGLGEIRSRVYGALQYLSTSSHEFAGQSDTDKGPTRWFLKTRRQTLTIWKAYYANAPLEGSAHEEFSRWGLPSIYPDVPLSALFDFGRHLSAFPETVQRERRRAGDMTLPSRLEGQGGKAFFDIYRIVCELQAGWAAQLFVLSRGPLPEVSTWRSIYAFSDQLGPGLVLLSELIELSYHEYRIRPTYRRMFKQSLNAYFGSLKSSGGSWADLLFLHCAVSTFCGLISGRDHRDCLLVPFESKNMHSRFQTIAGIPTVFEVVRQMFLGNPVSLLLLGPALSDAGFLLPEDKEKISGWSWLFETALSDETLFWLANHACSALMIPYCAHDSGEDNVLSVPPEELFARRLHNTADMIQGAVARTSEKTAAVRLSTFLAFFYQLLLLEWLEEVDIKAFPAHPLPVPVSPPIPVEVTFAYSYDTGCFTSGADEKKMGRDQGPPELEKVLFLYPDVGVPFTVEAEGTKHSLIIIDRENPKQTCLIERIVLWGMNNESLRDAVTALFVPLHSLMSESGIQRSSSFIKLRSLYRKTGFYFRLMSSHDEPFTQTRQV